MAAYFLSSGRRCVLIGVLIFCLYIILASFYFDLHELAPVRSVLENSRTAEWGRTNRRMGGSSALDKLISQTKTSSLRTLLTLLKDHAPTEAYGEEIQDAEAESVRCRRYGFQYNSAMINKTRRRVFWGSIIADDSWHTIATHAAETYGLYHTVALVESNTTLQLTQRQLRFPPDSLNQKVLQSGIFGPESTVSVDFYVDDPEGLVDRTKHGLLREQLQRELILQIWKRNGMKETDIGIVSDVDETFTRDFLLAAMTCDIPQFRPGQDCKKPKVIAKTLVFESSPECVVDKRSWFHPDMIIGECIDTIGDSTLHKPGQREYKNGTLGPRKGGYGKNENDYTMMPNTTMFPLWKPVDFRNAAGGKMFGDQQLDNGYTGYHFHNFFESIPVLRNKYKTYGHTTSGALQMPLGEIHTDIQLAINCVTQRPDFEGSSKRKAGGFKAIVGWKPLIFEHSEYRNSRNHELKEIVLEDEAKFGRYTKVTDNPTNAPITGSPSHSPTNAPVTDSPSKSPTNAPITGSPSHSPTNAPVTDSP